jgi:hypothetical protein
VTEARQRTWHRLPRGAPGAKIRVPADLAEGHHHPHVPQQGQLLEKIRLASSHLLRPRLVGGRRAAQGGGDVGAVEAEPIPGIHRRGLIGEPGLVERAKEPLSAPVSREHPPRPVTSVCRRGQSHHDNARPRISEAGERPRPVLLADIPARGMGRHRLPVPHQARAEPAADDAASELAELVTPADFADNHGTMLAAGAPS